MPPLFFLHLSRTGGTSLMHYLDSKFAPAAVCPAHEMFQFERLADENKLSGYDLYRGHFGIDFPPRVDPAGTVITFLRRPIPRLFSGWRHLRAHAVPFKGESGSVVGVMQATAEAAHRLGFEDFCYNMMRWRGPAFFNASTDILGSGRGRHLLQAPPFWATAEHMLAVAKQTIDRLAFVGFHETFAQSVAGLQRQFGWEAEDVLHVNTAPPAEMPQGEKFLAWLRFATRLDDELYEHAWRHHRDTIPDTDITPTLRQLVPNGAQPAIGDPTMTHCVPPLRYQARATVMFGAYAVWAIYADGSEKSVAHGTPDHCVALAERLNRERQTAGKPLFEGNAGSFPAPDQRALASLIRQVAHKNCRMAEIGSWLGTGSTQVFLKELDAHPGAEFICVDHWRGSPTVVRHKEIVAQYDVMATFLRNVTGAASSAKVTPLRQASNEAAHSIPDGTLDLAFIDADHAYRSIADDIAMWRPKVRKGGILCGHDCEVRVDAGNRARLAAARDDDACEIAGLPFTHVHAGVALAVDEAFQGGARLFAEQAPNPDHVNDGRSCIWWIEV